VTPYHVAVGAFTAGSAEVHRIREEVLALVGAGHDPVLIVPESFPDVPGVRAARFAASGAFGLPTASGAPRTAQRLAQERRASCVHTHGWEAIRPGLQAAREIGVPLVCDLWDSEGRGRHDRSLLALADRVICSAASTARRLGPSVRSGEAAHVPGAVETDDLPPSPPVAFRLPSERELLLVCAPLVEGDPDALLAALDAALTARPSLHLVLIGEPIGAGFMKAVSAHRMVPRVTFGGLPPLGAAARLAAGARAMLVALADPGHAEPYVLIARALGVSVVAYDTDDARALLGDGAAYAAEEGAGLDAALAAAVAAGRRAAPGLPAAFRRPALAERLLAVYASLAGRTSSNSAGT
jgi:glycosyltransferase involved in cell wall biosynthesis